jgi:TolB-like protein/DNA-binding winged helix-turn-helix (wHTH) protein/tetratricopeptide (TPR) repeat protein
MQNTFRLEDWIIRPQRSIIERGDETVHLKPKSMAVLECLALTAGEVVSRDTLFDTVWPGAVVSDDTLTQCIVELRKAFGDTAHDAKYIETIPKKGFRLVPAVESINGDPGNGKVESQPQISAGDERWYLSGRVVSIAAGVVFVVIVVAWNWLASPERQRTLIIEDTPSIAVLPFVHLGPATDQEYFADGLSEDLLNKLARIKDLRVSGRTSSFYFKGKNETLEEIGSALDVGYVLEGSVRRAGDELRITSQLVDVSNGYQVWSDNYDRPLDDIFEIQDEIAEAVAMALSITLGVGDIGSLVGGTTNPDAYNEYLLAQSLYREFTPGSISAALEKFKLAIEIDSNYALAWERIADIYVSSLYAPGLELPGDWRELSEEALNRAISLAPTSQAIIATTAYRHIHLNEWQEAARVLERGENPETSTNDTLVRTNAHLLGSVGRNREAIPLMERARRLDPLSGVVGIYLVPEYVEVGRYEEADAELERSWNLGKYRPLFGAIGLGLAFSSRNPRLMEKWVDRFLEVQNNYGREDFTVMFDLIDDREAALDWLRENHEAGEEVVPRYFISMWAAYHGDAELALKALPSYPNPAFYWYESKAGIRRLEGFKNIVRELGLVDYWREFGWSEHCRPVGEDDFECE